VAELMDELREIHLGLQAAYEKVMAKRAKG